ncbi:hypothetical protein [Corynebacterium lactis]|uniref:Uncharacterized protein n=1 Tax=Corynebacterium lactis RW2-5 TaxID=1408189 RepID=A0A0K2H3W2_9CORY|nr:hypothetical protein [Corynebacterium lactis]ALA68391.1 hypothetical protein CLAC_02030 [Corynebacterium lactis RW2-5]
MSRPAEVASIVLSVKRMIAFGLKLRTSRLLAIEATVSIAAFEAKTKEHRWGERPSCF